MRCFDVASFVFIFRSGPPFVGLVAVIVFGPPVFLVGKFLFLGFLDTNLLRLLDLHYSGIMDDDLNHTETQGINLSAHGFNPIAVRLLLSGLLKLFCRFHSFASQLRGQIKSNLY